MNEHINKHIKNGKYYDKHLQNKKIKLLKKSNSNVCGRSKWNDVF